MAIFEVYGASNQNSGIVQDVKVSFHAEPPGGWTVLNNYLSLGGGSVSDFKSYGDYLAVLFYGNPTELFIRKNLVWSRVSLSPIIFATRMYIISPDNILLLGQTIGSPGTEDLYRWDGASLNYIGNIGTLIGTPRGGLDGVDGEDYVIVLGTFSGEYVYAGGVLTPINRPGGVGADVQNLNVISSTEAYACLYYSSGAFPPVVRQWDGVNWLSTGTFPGSNAGARCYCVAKAYDGKLWAAGSANPYPAGGMVDTGTFVKPPGQPWQVNLYYGSPKIMYLSVATHPTDANLIAFGGRLEASPDSALYLEYLDGATGTVYIPAPGGPLPTGAQSFFVLALRAPPSLFAYPDGAAAAFASTPISARAYISTSARPRIRVIASNILRVFFNKDIAVNDALTTPENYNVTEMDSSSEPIRVLGVQGLQGPLDENGDLGFVQSADLVITSPTPDAYYFLEASGLRATNGDVVSDLTASFVSHYAKSDSFRSAFPSVYQLGTADTLMHVLLALSIEDDRIGGKDNLGALPDGFRITGSGTGSTLGSGTLATMTLGG